ncbi:hypothetical protein TSOC_007107 [Tetrabaena socialis]|uniref:Primase C-terminal 2 domain-containing protein n=1 Tax=Tetrabaena socialis TaxID=47790 RepID=A0A2J8A1R9_9CHLO|nr:hypothetical protein TSOC_007107 [Tetrabaena socialis]|eukprot:PNH06467.1 hypothetical protein TSOC_007107 [Tetrabaena socialis]
MVGHILLLDPSSSVPLKGRDLEQAAELLAEQDEKPHEFRELLTPATGPTKVYLDRYEYLAKEPSEEILLQKTEEIRRRIAAMFGEGARYALATRHGHRSKGGFKLSFRAYVQGYAIPSYRDIASLLRASGQAYFWNMSVYNEVEQLLPCINGRKGPRSPRVLLGENATPVEAGQIGEYLAQVVDPDWALLDTARLERLREATGHDLPNFPDLVAGSGGSRVDAGFVRDVLACIGIERAASYNDWRNVAFGLRALDRQIAPLALLEAFKAFSRRSPAHASPADQQACVDLWARLGGRGRQRTLGGVTWDLGATFKDANAPWGV